MELTLLARAFAVVMLLGLPVLALRTKLRDEHAEEIAAARNTVYLSAVLVEDTEEAVISRAAELPASMLRQFLAAIRED